MKQTARMHGFIRAISEQTHPLQTRLSLILTDFEPNRNKQAIPKTEAENILRTALNTPLKINFDGEDFHGHKNAIPIGPIVQAFADTDNGKDVIAGEAIIWNDVYGDVADHLKVAFAEGLGTSWEIYFEDSENDDNGVQWLHNCIFAGTCVVDTPAYGPNRTRILAIAEELNTRDINMESTMANEVANSADTEVQTLKTDISQVMDVLSNIYGGLWTMLDETDSLEQQLATTDMPSMAEQFTKLVASIQKRFDALKEKVTTAETALAETKTALETAQAEKARAEKLDSRKNALAEIGIELVETKEEFYLGMADEVFTQYVEDLKTVKSNAKASAETKVKVTIPEPVTDGTNNISIKDIARLFN